MSPTRPGWPSWADTALLRASFVLPEPIRELRDLTRARASDTRDRMRGIQRLEKFLEGSGIKLSSVVSDLTGVCSLGCSKPSSTGNVARNSSQDSRRNASRPTRLHGPVSPGPDRCPVPHHRRAHRTDRGSDGALSCRQGIPGHHPRSLTQSRRRDHRRNRRRHVPFRNTRQARVLDRRLSWLQRISRQDQIRAHPAQQQIPQPHWAPRHCPRPEARTPAWPQNTGASPPAADP